MKKVIGMFALLLLGSPLAAEESKDDPVLMKINGKNITRGEFEYAYNKNSDVEGGVEEKSVDEYVDMFVNYQLKVEAALEAQLDTLASFRKEYHTYRDMQLTPLLQDTMYIDSVARARYDRNRGAHERRGYDPAGAYLPAPAAERFGGNEERQES